MHHILVLLALALVGCAPAPAEGPSAPARPSPDAPAARVLERPAQSPEERQELGACYAAFDDVAAAWEAVMGPLSAECRSVAASYEVRLVDVVPCKASDGSPVDGCAVIDEHVVYVLEDASPAGQVFVAAHEWVHVLGDCADGDSNHNHTDPGRWSLKDGVLGLAVADPPVGPCVERP